MAAKAFWQQEGSDKDKWTRATEIYLSSGTAVAVKGAISEVLTNHNGSFDTDEIKTQLVQIALDNQLGMFINCQCPIVYTELVVFLL